METKYGTSRVAYVGEQWTYKRPLMHPKTMWNGALAPIPNALRGRWKYVQWFFTQGADCEESLLWCLGQDGLLENRRETASWKEIGDLVFPTRSVAGNLLVRQETTGDIPLTHDDVVAVIKEMRLMFSKSPVMHTFGSTKNYGCDRETGTVRLRDYGGEGVAKYLVEHRSSVMALLQKIKERIARP